MLRLGEALGEEVRAEIAGQGAVEGSDELFAHVEDLSEKLLEAREDIRRPVEELEAARATNRGLLARINRNQN